LPFFAIIASAIYSLGTQMPALRFSQVQEFPFGRYSDFTTMRALCAADKGRCCGLARNPLSRLGIFSASPLCVLHRNINRLGVAVIFPLTY
ncbi:MAG TPA: hypothetical protein VHT48_05565, partial [Methylocella sp.]|nr:hypothetical protein [Methylocella sp.]